MRENQILKDNLRIQDEKRKPVVIQKSKAQVGSNRHRQLQQTPIFYQEMQEMGKSRVGTNIIRGKIGKKHQLNGQVQQGEVQHVDHMTQILL